MTKRKRLKKGEFDDDNDEDENEIPHFPDTIIFDILSRESAGFLQDVGRFVCKSWGTTISSPRFIKKHLSLSNPILFFKNHIAYTPVFYIEHQGKRLQRFKFKDIFEGDIMDSSVGMMLYSVWLNRVPCLFLRNCITRQISKLPYPPLAHPSAMSKMNVSYLSLTGEVKVICNYIATRGFLWSVLTVDTDSNMTWRILDVSPTINDAALFSRGLSVYSFSVGGMVIYWTSDGLTSHMTFVAVDLQDETFHLVHVPSICDRMILWNVIPMGTELYVISVDRNALPFCSDNDYYKDGKLRVWKMKDYRKSEWVEVLAIQPDEQLESILMDHYCHFLAWYEKYEILVYRYSTSDSDDSTSYDRARIMAHNFKLRKSYFITNSKTHLEYFHTHTNSLFHW